MAENQKEKEKETPEAPAKKESNNSLLIVLAVVVGLLILYVAGSRILGGVGRKVSEKAVEEAIERAADGKAQVDISSEQERVTIETEEGAITIGTDELPENFPSNFPTYPGAKVSSTASSQEQVTVAFTTSDSVEKVGAFYLDKLASSDWEIKETATLANSVVFGVEKAESGGAVIINSSEEGTVITISLEL